MGDALAGIFAPIAFLWLVLGYVQQGKQLEQNTKALQQQERVLQLQIDEIKETTNQQKIMAHIQTRDLKATLQAVKPSVEFSKVKGELVDKKIADGRLHYFHIKVNLSNYGKGDAFDLSILSLKNRPVQFVKKLKKIRILKYFFN